ncbi:hypothetical protein EVAR_93222_1 [Eumeta japonica]|uniref:Uncharacterized protein n=1 Tax=Eumeta variegata TaxID=151549 RepID=A0A4C1TY59_EUMVA|nr:hypothetical protein EVAR_93222_1 [Eumeta japonica]
MGVGTGRRTYILEIRPRRIKWQWLEPLFLVSCRCRSNIARGRARSSRMRSQQAEGGHRLDGYPRIRRQQPGRHASASRVLQPLRSVLDRDVNPVPTPSHPRARASPRMRSRRWRGHPARWLVLDECGRKAQLKLHTQPTAGGRTLVDADRIKAARIGDPLGVDLTERACRPLIRLSTHPTAAARAVRVSEPHPSTSSFCPVLGRDVNPVPTPGHPRARA